MSYVSCKLSDLVVATSYRNRKWQSLDWSIGIRSLRRNLIHYQTILRRSLMQLLNQIRYFCICRQLFQQYRNCFFQLFQFYFQVIQISGFQSFGFILLPQFSFFGSSSLIFFPLIFKHNQITQHKQNGY